MADLISGPTGHLSMEKMHSLAHSRAHSSSVCNTNIHLECLDRFTGKDPSSPHHALESNYKDKKRCSGIECQRRRRRTWLVQNLWLVMRAVLSYYLCDQSVCCRPGSEEIPCVKATLIFKHAIDNQVMEASMRTKWSKQLATAAVQEYLLRALRVQVSLQLKWPCSFDSQRIIVMFKSFTY